MNFTTTIDNVHSLEWGLSLSEAYIFSWIKDLSKWAQRISFEDKDYYFGSRTKCIAEMPLLTDKPDTIYRIYRDLQAKGLILYEKIGKCDYLHVTEKGKEWERATMSDLIPSIGKKSEKDSDLNPNKDSENFPTYKDINNTYDNTYLEKKETHSISKSGKGKSKPQPILLSIPNCLNTPEFMERWGALLKTKKWCKKANSTLQNILEELSKYDVEFAIKIMGNTIMNEYQGLIFDNTPEVYEKWKKAKASTPQNQIFQQPHPNTPEKPLYCIVNEWQGKKKWAKVWRWANKVAVLENDTERIEFNSLEVVQMSQYKEPIILR